MGGYASLVCGNLLGAHASVAECPQIELFDYPLSKKYLNKIVEPSRTTTNLFEFLRANFKDLYIFIYVNIGDISHISYIYSHLCDKKYTMLFKKLNKININIRSLPGRFGHTCMNKNEALFEIRKIFSFKDSLSVEETLTVTATKDGQKIFVHCQVKNDILVGDVEYAFYLLKCGIKIQTRWYTENNNCCFYIYDDSYAVEYEVCSFVLERYNHEQKLKKLVHVEVV